MNTVKNKLPESCDYKDVPSPNNEKPIAITVLCYRVVGASGDLTGLASGLK
jgi:O6-methylguanine-DNA--protein-cysteine methyltransferase